jgi:hypothetical protein
VSPPQAGQSGHPSSLTNRTTVAWERGLPPAASSLSRIFKPASRPGWKSAVSRVAVPQQGGRPVELEAFCSVSHIAPPPPKKRISSRCPLQSHGSGRCPSRSWLLHVLGTSWPLICRGWELARSVCLSTIGNLRAHNAGARLSSCAPRLSVCQPVCRSAAGAHSETAPGQWAYSIGPCHGVELGDQLWVSRYLLQRCSEHFNLVASLDPKPVPGEWAGDFPCARDKHLSFSTRKLFTPSRGSCPPHLRAPSWAC